MFKHLNWDSDFFGFKTAVLTEGNNSAEALKETLAGLRYREYKLAYLFTDPGDELLNESALDLNGKLVDKKVTFGMQLPESAEIKTESPVIKYPEEVPTPELYRLAIESGEYSRFKLDPDIPFGKFEDMYQRWIRNAASGEKGTLLYIYPGKDGIMGMVTVDQKPQAGSIGLIAVQKDSHGKGIGRELVERAINHCIDLGKKRLEVVTQKANHSACRFYDRTGFSIVQIKYVYHFWIG